MKAITKLANGEGVHYDSPANGWWDRSKGWIKRDDKAKTEWVLKEGASMIPVEGSCFMKGVKVTVLTSHHSSNVLPFISLCAQRVGTYTTASPPPPSPDSAPIESL